MSDGLWPTPRQRNVGAFSDLSFYVDALEQARAPHGVTAAQLQDALAPRLRSLRRVEQPGPSTICAVLEELRLFGWVSPADGSAAPRIGTVYTLTAEGEQALRTGREGPRRFLRLLAVRMHAVYTIPGWFVARLWAINPRQGEVILPAPAHGWAPSEQAQTAGGWTAELEEEARRAARRARTANAAAFPVADDDWVAAVARAWQHVRDRKRRNRREGQADRVPWSRAGLLLAMRMAALDLLFAAAPYPGKAPDIAVDRPLSVKTFKPWCPRLQALELVAYTEWHPAVVGRLLFPTAVFRAEAPPDEYEELPGVCHPDGRRLFLHQPDWPGMRDRFWASLTEVYQGISRRLQARYVSLFDVRDEVCRRLRLSPLGFDDCFERALDESSAGGGWQLSIETDIREDQRAGGQLERRPVYVGKIPYTLVALTRVPEAQRRIV
jgi:hypothetical protein